EELYAVRHGDRASGGGRVEVLGWIGAAELDGVLCGWGDKCGRLGSFRWLRARALQNPPQRNRRRRRGADHAAPAPWGARPSRTHDALSWLAFGGPPPTLGR
ncbi:MAG: hypothetical protein QOE08_327, partial [Thermoleophilaceae bacterium]|nr:hypothetical protein [Thermoleophilaceae bacterium]